MDNEAVIRELLKAKDMLFAAHRMADGWIVCSAIEDAQERLTDAIKYAERAPAHHQPARGAES